MEFSVIERFLGCALYETVHFEERRASKAEQGKTDTKKGNAREFRARASRSVAVSAAREIHDADQDF